MSATPTSTSLAPHTPRPHDDLGEEGDVDTGSSTSLLRSAGRLIQALRNQAGLTQAEFGQRIGYGEEMVSKVERGIRIPRAEFLDNADRALNAHGVLTAMKDELSRATYSGILRNVHQEEAHATAIHAYDTHVLNALLHTEDYMRALFTMHTPPLPAKAIQQRITARLVRQQVLRREPVPPIMSFVIDEAVLRRPYGGNDVLRGQLEHLIQVGQLPHIDLQVMPLDQEHHAGAAGPFTLMDTRKHTRNAYIEIQGLRIHAEQDRVRDLEATYSRIRAQALPPKDTLHFIEKLLAGSV